MLKPAFNPSRAAQFGPEYEQLLLTIWEKPPFRFPLETARLAQSMRAKFYAYVRMLRDENLRLDLIEMADSITVTISDNVLTFQKNEETWDHEALRAILGLEKDKFGLKPQSNGAELKSPDLLNNRLAQQVSRIRERTAGGKKVVPPMKTGK